jgi:8-oxo-dGTP pyrophosphatase MutT (NUDIX family)
MTSTRDLLRPLLANYEPKQNDEPGLIPAAVMLLLYERDGEEHLLFQVRSQLVEHHKGEISLPGGARDPEDESLLATALRETHEEIGVPPEHIEVFGRIDDFTTRTNFVMAPYIGAIIAPAPYPFRAATLEVDQLLEVPVAHLLSPVNAEEAIDPLGRLGRSYRFGDHLIFGATARVLDAFLGMLADGLETQAAALRA